MNDFEELRIFQQIKAKFGLGSEFTSIYLNSLFDSSLWNTLDLENLNFSPLQRIWINFALSTNQRGETFYQELATYLHKNWKRYLDVGCGYGGFMVAFHQHGYSVAGIDLNPDLVRLSQANLNDFGIQGTVMVGDILQEGIIEKTEGFDVITCYDVIEHVDDVPKCLGVLVDLLKPGGLIGLKIPNKDCLKFVASDGHYNLFGITLMDHIQAEKYYQALFSGPYGVGEYYLLDTYTRELERCGCTCQAIPRKNNLALLRGTGYFLKLMKDYLFFKRNLQKKLPPEIAAEISAKFWLYLQNFVRAKFNPKVLYQRYISDTWTVLATKNN